MEKSTKQSDNKMTTIPPKNAKVVICGAGVMGAAVAYQLANSGLGAETVILEQATYDFFIGFSFLILFPGIL